METATANSRTLKIDGMTGDACVQKVRTALLGVERVTTQNVKVGSATIEADQAGSNAACAAVTGAGYKCTAATEASGAAGANDRANKAPTEQADGRQLHSGTKPLTATSSPVPNGAAAPKPVATVQPAPMPQKH